VDVSYAPWGETIGEIVEASVAAEAAGFTDVWISELHRSAFVPAAAIASATNAIGVGTAIALAFVRSPMITALTALDLDDLSSGRFTLGIGSGVRRLNENWHNARFGSAAAHLRETIGIIRRLVGEAHLGKPIEIDGEHEHVRIRGYERPFPPMRERIPIYIAAVGDVMTRLAGETADGWLAHELGSPRYLQERILPNIEGGLARGERARSDIKLVASACCVVDDDARQAKRWAAGLIAFYATVRTYEAFFAFHGFDAEARAIQERFKAGDTQGMIDATPDEMVDVLTLAGTADDVRRRIGAYEGIADGVKLSPPTHLVPPAVTRACQKAIVEGLAP
jgi:probable F420-dependent oxidoreductase